MDSFSNGALRAQRINGSTCAINAIATVGGSADRPRRPVPRCAKPWPSVYLQQAAALFCPARIPQPLPSPA